MSNFVFAYIIEEKTVRPEQGKKEGGVTTGRAYNANH